MSGVSSQLIDHYLRHIATEKRLAERTQQLYIHELNRLADFARETKIEAHTASNAHLRRWVAALHAQGLGSRSLSLALSVWRGWYAWLGMQGHIKANPAIGLRAPKKAQTLPKALAVDDAMLLANYANERADKATGADKAPALRDAAIVELLYGSGLRISELMGLDVAASAAAESEGRGWVDMPAAEVHVHGKGGKRRSTPVGRRTLQALEQWLAVRSELLKAGSEESALFLGARGGRISKGAIWQMLRVLSVESGLPVQVHAHVLRHSFASHVLQSSGDLRAVQELLGHANIGTTQIYTKLDFQHLAQVYDDAHPRAKKKE